ncbi:MAG: hypothetical protein LLF86_07295 [Nitrospiraceae bacterium]|nr:hypothetical protein [Nitrospiraceae bacterium]
MSRKNVLVCVKKDLVNPISFALKEFERQIKIRYADDTKHLAMLLAELSDNCVIILDSHLGKESTVDYAKSIKAEKPFIKILLIVSTETPKPEIVDMIQSKTASGVLIRPFTAEQLCDNIYKLFGIKKPEDTPWYMQTGLS